MWREIVADLLCHVVGYKIDQIQGIVAFVYGFGAEECFKITFFFFEDDRVGEGAVGVFIFKLIAMQKTELFAILFAELFPFRSFLDWSEGDFTEVALEGVWSEKFVHVIKHGVDCSALGVVDKEILNHFHFSMSLIVLNWYMTTNIIDVTADYSSYNNSTSRCEWNKTFDAA